MAPWGPEFTSAAKVRPLHSGGHGPLCRLGSPEHAECAVPWAGRVTRGAQRAGARVDADLCREQHELRGGRRARRRGAGQRAASPARRGPTLTGLRAWAEWGSPWTSLFPVTNVEDEDFSRTLSSPQQRRACVSRLCPSPSLPVIEV